MNGLNLFFIGIPSLLLWYLLPALLNSLNLGASASDTFAYIYFTSRFSLFAEPSTFDSPSPLLLFTPRFSFCPLDLTQECTSYIHTNMSLLDLDSPSGSSTNSNTTPLAIPSRNDISSSARAPSPRFHGSHIHPAEQSGSPVAVAYDK